MLRRARRMLRRGGQRERRGHGRLANAWKFDITALEEGACLLCLNLRAPVSVDERPLCPPA
eukprot:6176022-Pleurochrysis_carterae.AAC.2